MMAEMNQETATISAVLDLFTYLDIQKDFEEPLTLHNIIEEIVVNYPPHDEDDEFRRSLETIRNAIDNNPHIGELRLVSQSHFSADELSLGSGGTEYTGVNTCKNDLIEACAFVDDSSNELYVAYRGTGDGRWIDNAKGFVGASTPMQEAATRYFDDVYSRYATDDMKVYVTGHSKGGNEAQYVMLTSKYASQIDGCYSFDGQGFSEAAIKEFEKLDDYEERLARMYSINGKDDPVHDLINVVIPDENTYYLDNGDITLDTIVNVHDLTGIFTDGSLNWMDGDIHGEEGEISKLAKKINDAINELPDSQKEKCAVTVMAFIERVAGNGELYIDGMDGSQADLTDCLTFIVDGLPVVIATILESEENREVLGNFISEGIEKLYDTFGLEGIIGIVAVGAIIGAVVVESGLFSAISAVAFSAIIYVKICDFIDQIKDTAEKIKKCFNEMKEAFVEAVNRISAWLKSYTAGYKYANENPQITVDTYKLRSYAGRIQKVNGRISSLDSRLDSLYWKVGLLDLWNLLQADLLTSYSWRLVRCASYLNDTASDFDTVESSLISAL